MDRGRWTLNKYFFLVKQRKYDDVYGFSAIQFLSIALEFWSNLQLDSNKCLG